MLKVGMITIGQSPRDDVVPELLEIAESSFEAVQSGALDGLDTEEISDLSPEPGDEVLVTTLRDGTEVSVGRKPIVRKVQAKVKELQNKVEFITLLCSGTFPPLDSTIPLIRPNMLLTGTLSSIFLPGKLGMLVPSEEQIDQITEQFDEEGFEVRAKAASPYSASENKIRKTAEVFKNEDTELIVMNCFGYNLKQKKVVAGAFGKPVIMVRSLLARTLTELSA